MACDSCGAARGHLNGCPEAGPAQPDPRERPDKSKRAKGCPAVKMGSGGHIHECRLNAGHRGKHVCRSGDGETWG